MQSTKLEQPIELVGEHVKSGQKILADYDAATGAVQMRQKWIHLGDVVMAKIEEMREWEARAGTASQERSVEEELAQVTEAQERLAEESEAIQSKVTSEAPTSLLDAIDKSKIDPAVLIMMQQQQQMIAALQQQMQANQESNEQAALSRQASMIEEGRREMKIHQDRLADDLRFSSEHEEVPPPPNKNPRFGDKTPAYVDWLRRYRPDVYEDRYGVQEFDKTLVKMDGEGVPRKRVTDIAARRTHRSEKIERDPSLAADQDWNA